MKNPIKGVVAINKRDTHSNIFFRNFSRFDVNSDMSSTTERKLAAIMFTDIAGYTSQMSKDQDVALSMLDTKRKALKPLIQKYNGTLIKEMGDGTLSHFSYPIDATKCSTELQKSLKNNDKLNVRIGIHHGEALFRDKDVFGDVVNIASRLETMAPPGGILVSKNVYDELKGYDGISLGLQSMKGVGRLVEVFGLKDEYLNVPNPAEYKDNYCGCHSHDEVPSVVILPFKNKGKEADEFYSYGIWLDLITEVSSAGLIRVTSKQEIDKMGDISIKEMPKKLCVRYIVNGELWKLDDKFQLFIELYDTKESKIVWTDRWQEKWDNLSNIKDNLSDGLLKALDTTSKVGKKVNITNTEAYEFYLKGKHKYEKRKNTDDTKLARGLLQKAIDLDDKLIGAKIILGSTYLDIGDYDKAMEIYSSTFKQAEELNDKHGIGHSLHNIGAVYYSKGDYGKALDCYERSFAISEGLGDKLGMGNSLHNIGIMYDNKGDYEKSLEYFKQSLAISEELGNKRGMGRSINNIGIVYNNKSDYGNALDYFEQSLAINEEICDKHGMGNNLNNLGNVYDDKGNYAKALDCYERALVIRKEVGDKHGIAQSLNNIGLVYYDKGDYGKALGCYESSIAISEELGNKRGLIYVFSSIGNVYAGKGDYDKALDYHERSLKIAKELDNKSGIKLSLNNIGLVYSDKGNYEKALNYQERSLSISEELGDILGIGNSLHNIASVYGDKGDYDKALSYYERALAMLEEIGYKRGLVFTFNSIGIMYYNKADYGKAMKYLEKSLSIQKDTVLKPMELETTTYFCLTYKHLNKEYDAKKIYSLIKEARETKFCQNYRLYQLLEKTSYLETAYNQVQVKVSAMEDGAKFLSCPIPKAIIKEYNKVFKNN